ncbi:anti-sigma factor family protein [Elioraea rosea]|uniref:anti-sigma factor family protein n=1 Tax=Elioraea rosea TaxID=2492390 RepID=UPI001182057C|nr:anti-sigma factor [Elioraea rosea]
MADPRPLGEDDLQAFVDGRADAEAAARVQAYLADRPEVAARVAAMAGDRAALKEALRPIAEEPVPARLRVSVVRAAQRERVPRRTGQLTAIAAASLVLGLIGGWHGRGLLPLPAGEMRAEAPMGDAVAAYRVFAAAGQVAAGNGQPELARALVELSARAGQAVSPPDFSDLGLSLVEGRKLATEDGSAVLLIYADGEGRRVTLYIRPDSAGRSGGGQRLDGGVRTRYWFRSGLGIALSAPGERDDLIDRADLFQQRL